MTVVAYSRNCSIILFLEGKFRQNFAREEKMGQGRKKDNKWPVPLASGREKIWSSFLISRSRKISCYLRAKSSFQDFRVHEKGLAKFANKKTPWKVCKKQDFIGLIGLTDRKLQSNNIPMMPAIPKCNLSLKVQDELVTPTIFQISPQTDGQIAKFRLSQINALASSFIVTPQYSVDFSPWTP